MVMVTAKGHTSFVVQYRNADKQSRRMSLKAGLSLQEARREAKKIIGDVARGGDRLGEKRKAAGGTLEAVAEATSSARRSSCERQAARKGVS
jgi:hypothetical protein